MSIARILTYQTYLLQQENYELRRFLKAVWVKTLNFKSLTFRQEIVWTTKLKLVTGLALIILIIEQIAFVSWLGTLGWILLLIKLPFLFLAFCLYLSLVVVILKPFDIWQKNKIINQGRTKLAEWKKSNRNNKVIAIAGSYGKSSVKNALEIILSQKFKVLATTGNQNTPMGISRMMNKGLNNDVEIVILELGEYVVGDVRELCEFYKPDLGVITGINEAHMERMGGIDNTIKSIFELAESLPKESKIYLNQHDKRVIDNYQKFCENLNSSFYSQGLTTKFPSTEGWTAKQDGVFIGITNQSSTFDLNTLSYNGQITNGTETQNFELNMLAKYGLGLVDLVTQVGLEFDMNLNEIAHGIKEIKPVPHRLELIKGQNGTIVIDDSYNGNPEGVRAAIEVLNLFKQQSPPARHPELVSGSPTTENKYEPKNNPFPKGSNQNGLGDYDTIENTPFEGVKPKASGSLTTVYCTPGLVEIGKSSETVHYQLGKELAAVVDVLILVRNANTESMAKGYCEIKPEGIIKYYESGPELHSKFGEMLKGGEVILFQNDLTDNY